MPRSFGLDTKQGYLLCAEAQYNGGDLHGVTLSYTPLAEGVMDEAGNLEPVALQTQLTDHLGPGLEPDHLAVVLEGPDVITRALAPPPLPTREMEQKLLAEVMEFKVFDGKTLALSFHPTGALPKEGESGQPLLELVVNEEKLDPWRAAVGGLNPQGASVGSAFLALLRLYYWTKPPEADRGQVVLLVEDGVTHVVNLLGGAVRFIRAFEIGSTLLMQAAEERSMGQQGLAAAEEDFLDETVRTVRYLYTTFTDQAFEPTVHLLARSYVPGQLAEHLQAQLGLAVEVVDPFTATQVANLAEVQEAGVDPWLFTQAMGAALYPVSPGLLPLNVFPAEVFQKRELMRSALFLLSPVAAAVFLPLALNLLLKGQVNQAKTRQQEQAAQVATLTALAQQKPGLERALKYVSRKNRAATRQGGGTEWPRFVFELTNLFPERSWLSEISYVRDTRQVTFTGLTTTPGVLFKLEENLRKSPFLEQVVSRGAESQKPFEGDATPLHRFTFQALVKVKETE